MTVKPSRSYTLPLITLLAVLARVVWACLSPVVPISDCAAYDAYATTLANYNIYGLDPQHPSAFWPVGTSFIYSLFFRLFGHSYLPIVIFNVAIGSIAIYLLAKLVERWHGRKVAVIAGLLLALWPMHVEFTTVLASELIFTTILLAALFVAETCRGIFSYGVLVGLLLALASYIRPTALLIPIVFFGLQVLRQKRLLIPLKRLIVVIVTMSLLIVPWSVRNTRVFHQFVLISTNGGTNTWMGNNPKTSGEYMVPPSLPNLNEAERDKLLGSMAKQYIREHPMAFVERTAVKLVRLHERESIGVGWNNEGLRSHLSQKSINWLKLFSNIYWWIVLLLAIIGMGWLLYTTGASLLCHPAFCIWMYFAILHAATVIQDRYHFPAIPFIAALAAVAVARALKVQPESVTLDDRAHVATVAQ